MSKPPILRRWEFIINDEVGAEEIRAMTLQEALIWAADEHDERLDRDRLRQVARARGYEAGWVNLHVGRHWKQSFDEMVQFAIQQRRNRKRDR